ncbi:MAG: hypothetical protein WAL50_02215 [Kineosporiaceae bacterium]
MASRTPRVGRGFGWFKSPLPELLVGLTAAGVYVWRVNTPSPWRDEMDTLSIARRSVHDIIALTRHVDAVHRAYYLLSHVVLGISGTVTAIRLMSVVAMAGATAVVVHVGRGLGEPGAGVSAGLVLAVSPLASRYAQEARPFAIVTAVGAMATALLVAAVWRASEGRRAGPWWLGYGVAVVLLGTVNVLALLLLVAHGAFVVSRARGTIGRWLSVTVVAVGVLGPHLVGAFGQREQVRWATRPHVYDLTGFYISAFGTKALPLLIAMVTVVVVLVRLVRARWNLRATVEALPATLILGVTWAVLPAVTLWLLSQVVSFWHVRYLVYCLPGLALWVAALPGAVRDVAMGSAGKAPGSVRPRTSMTLALAGTVVLVAALGLPAQRDYRDPSAGHGEDIRAAVALLDAEARPGDAVLYAPHTLRAIDTWYAQHAPALDDVALEVDPLTAQNLAGIEVLPADLPRRLDQIPRVWLVYSDALGPSIVTPTDAAKFTLPQDGYARVAHHQFVSLTVDLYQRGLGQ